MRFSQSLVVTDLRTALGLRLYRYPWCIDDELKAVANRLRPGDVFIDGGANIGLFTLVAAERVGPSGAVIAIEPGPVRHALRRNVEVNGYDWVIVVPVALGSSAGRRPFTVFGGDGAGLSSFAPLSSGGDTVEVSVCRLDDVVPVELMDRVRMVKLDLEGAEVEALRGAPHLLGQTDVEFLVEVEAAHLERQGASSDDLRRLFDGFDQRGFDNSPNVLFSRRKETGVGADAESQLRA